MACEKSLRGLITVEQCCSKVDAAFQGLASAIKAESFSTKFSYVALAMQMSPGPAKRGGKVGANPNGASVIKTCHQVQVPFETCFFGTEEFSIRLPDGVIAYRGNWRRVRDSLGS